jgi:asparagine synthase (glutamine-hydrolysing)
MCGLAGFIGDGTADDIRAMTARLAHRGPDDEAFYAEAENRLHLGFRRLIILDAPHGRQPMRSADGDLTVVFNGEIYNHRALRAELESGGHRFVSDHSDTEILLHGYRAWGDELPLHLDGMFAFALWDQARRRLFCARDRFGEKPFYYQARPGCFLFASEIGALHAHPLGAEEYDPGGVQKYFAYGYVPAPRTIYRQTRKLAPGGVLVFEAGSGRVRESRYWRFAITAEGDAPAHRIPALAEELRHLLDQAVRRRLEADVPLGVFLSGGLDSTAMLALAARARGATGVDSYTIGFREPSYDESEYARRAAAEIGSRHHERIVDLDAARAELPALLGRLDEPFADPSLLPTHLLGRFAREQVTVALSGDGGDELFAGYDPLVALAPAGFYRRWVPKPLHGLLRRGVKALPRGKGNMSLDFRLRRTLRGLTYKPALWNPVWLGPLDPGAFAACFENPLPPEELFEEAVQAWEGCKSPSLVDRTLEFYTNFYLPEMILAKADRASMFASLESRAPFLDRDLVAFCQRLPHGYKLRGGERKFLLKAAMRGIVPDFVLARRKKGFGIPLTTWLGALTPERMGLPAAAGLRAGYAAARWEGFAAGREDERLFLWAHLTLEAGRA